MADHVPHVHAEPHWLLSPPVQTVAKVALFATIVAFAGSIIFDRHTHTCNVCGNKWRHLGAFNVNDASAHTCTQCGNTQWWKDLR